MQTAEVARLTTKPDGKAVLEVAGQPVFELNRVGASIWTKLSSGLSVEEINRQIAEEFGAPKERVESDVAKFVEVLRDRLLLYDEN
ncbi:MAG: hypothetical protein DMG37_23925 [Acidobacteria bacterium]|nr:MAG: hypothetical protein DMG37_23925 [Acidobacteriota bacterium]